MARELTPKQLAQYTADWRLVAKAGLEDQDDVVLSAVTKHLDKLRKELHSKIPKSNKEKLAALDRMIDWTIKEQLGVVNFPCPDELM